MDKTISTRGIVRLVSFGIAIFGTLLAVNIMYMSRLETANRAIEYGYMRALSDLSYSADNISTTLTKGLYSASPEMMETLSAKLINDSSAAKAALAQLPTGDEVLENTNKFLSQVGNYAMALSKKAAGGEKLSDEEYENLKKLSEFSQQLCDDMWELESRVSTGTLTLNKVVSGAESGNVSDTPAVTDGFKSLEEGFDSYPTLIYDGPFSDHILEKEPLMTKNQPEVSREQALAKASAASGVPAESLKDSEYQESGKMPSYGFTADGVDVTVTKNGGYLCYMLKSRNIEKSSLSAQDALTKAKEYMLRLGIENMESNYYECYNNVCTINFNYVKEDVSVYTDLIKISVALDNGEILGFDGRGYLVNHTERAFPEPALTMSEAKEKLSPLLRVENCKKALIPSDGLSETLTYEFSCLADSGKRVLVYINVLTGEEEEILILIESESGVLTV